jgi:hypothetical protein
MAGSRIPDVVAAAVSALATDATLATLLGGPKAYTHVPQNSDPPWVWVLGGDEVPWAVTLTDFASPSDYGDSGGRQCDVVVQCASTYRGTKEVDGIASRVMEVLIDGDPWTATALSGFQLAELVRNSALPAADLFADGRLWFQRAVVVRVSLT